MIIIKLKGGLGNQIFQYCFAKSLSQELNKELYLDISFYNHGLARHQIYGLNSFNIKGIVGNYPYFNINTKFKILYKIIYRLKNSPLTRKIIILNKLCNIIKNNSDYAIKFYFNEPEIFASNSIVDENLFSFNSIETPSYFEGYFQFYNNEKNQLYITERFFKKYNKLIHEDLTYLPQLTEKSQKIAKDMGESNSVLLHVRHGDYVGLLDFGLCSEEYYEKSMEIIASKVENPKFFIFSDDIEGAKKLKINYPHVFVDFKENNELNARGNGELLKLMSSCKHFIIANSSLSWWASFLSENEDKIIITPQPWFQSRRILGVETIDNKKPIKVINNNAKLFNDSKKIICNLNEEEFIFKNINFEKNGNSYKIKNITNDSSIILNNKKNTNQIIVKLSIESNHFNCFKILFKTKNNKNYCNENTFNVYYYEDDDFDQYLLFPKNAILDELKIMPGKQYDNKDYYVTIKSLEIKELNE
jgi:hypothetical protein